MLWILEYTWVQGMAEKVEGALTYEDTSCSTNLFLVELLHNDTIKVLVSSTESL